MLTKIAHRIIANPWVFDRFQNLMGVQKTIRRLKPYLAEAGGRVVLDIGGGTGNFGTVVPQTSTYICLDIDWQKHEGFKRKWPKAMAIQGDATQICLRDKSVDYAICVSLTHHLTNEQLPMLFSELARVVKRRLVFLDAVQTTDSKISALLWRYDRGAYPKSAQTLKTTIERYFDIEQIEQYTIHHRYILCAARPKEV